MASEFFIMSALFRMGLEPLLTLGNKKGVDVYVPASNGRTIAVEVKAVAGKMDWLLGDREFATAPNKWVALVCYNGDFASPTSLPDTWVVPSTVLAKRIVLAGNKKTRFLRRRVVRDELADFANDLGWQKLRDAAL